MTKGVVFFYFPGKDTFRMEISKKEWVSENRGIFFFPLPTFSEKKNTLSKSSITIFMKKNPITWCGFVFFRKCNPYDHFFVILVGVHQGSLGQTWIIWNFWTVFFFPDPEKKKYRKSRKGVSEWLSIFSREKIKYDTFGGLYSFTPFTRFAKICQSPLLLASLSCESTLDVHSSQID